MYRGVLVVESLGAHDDIPHVRMLGRENIDISAPPDGQPRRWTLATFEIDDAVAEAAAAALCERLLDGPWYVDFNNGEHSFVVFCGEIFSYHRGDTDTLAAARRHASAIGVPDAQIDWDVPS